MTLGLKATQVISQLNINPVYTWIDYMALPDWSLVSY